MTDTDAITREKPVHLADEAELDAFVAEHDLALVDFYTKGCSLCQAIEPVVGNVARATDAAVGMLNPRDDLSLVEAHDVRSVPTLLLFEDGELVGRMAEGFQGTESVVEFVESRGRTTEQSDE
ncbi:thioredoxin family protein [Halorussus limi]|uniref:Thioredoxin family protein n=1 Tax=Halorussus limi TaxID=2938695 RepID=A0A8U0HPD3_9EURY|nr:thioredoxin family protein [Halorussus limi]UPV72810.1 thioredoxin family protein [Halorussus limi]